VLMDFGIEIAANQDVPFRARSHPSRVALFRFHAEVVNSQ
jgi:hypothetical protein